MMIKPTGHRVLVTPDAKERITEGGIILTEQTQTQEQQAQIFGTVADIGANAFKAFDDGHAWCKIGDRVAFAKYGGFVIRDPHTQEQFRLLNDEDICAIITE
jgi:co-chaperonin GroES (HSP10)